MTRSARSVNTASWLATALLAAGMALTLGGCASKAPPEPVGVSGRPLPRQASSATALDNSGAPEDGEEAPSHQAVEPLALPFAGKKRHAQQRDEDVEDEGSEDTTADDGVDEIE